jgi:uncharacterized repeat protein (TIGR03803 family)
MEPLSRLRVAISLAVVAVALSRPAGGQTYEVLHVFTGEDPDGALPRGTLLLVGDELFGTTELGGTAGDLCVIGCGTVFKIDAAGAHGTVHAFDSSTEGILPWSGVILGSNGKFYGTTSAGGNGDGTVYSMTTDGTVETVLNFDQDAGGLSRHHFADGGNGRLPLRRHRRGEVPGRNRQLSPDPEGHDGGRLPPAAHVLVGGGLHSADTAAPDLGRRLLRHDEPGRRRQPERLRRRVRYGLPHERRGRSRAAARLRAHRRRGPRPARCSSRRTASSTE